MKKFIYLLINLDTREVHGTDDAEDVSEHLHNDDYIVICTTGPTQSFSSEGEMEDVPALNEEPEDEEAEED